MSTQMVVSLVVTLAIGGVIGSGVTQQLMPTLQVTCSGTDRTAAQAAAMQQFLTRTPMPLTGGKAYP